MSVHGKFWQGKLANLANRELFEFFSPIFTDTPKMYLTYALTVAYSPNISSLIKTNGSESRPRKIELTCAHSKKHDYCEDTYT